MTDWIKEMSFKLMASKDNLSLQCNCRGKVIEVQKVSGKFNIRFLSNEKRVSYENGKLFDFHGLSVLKGNEASTRMIAEIGDFVPQVKQDLISLSTTFGIPVNVALTGVEDLGRLYLDERRFLDFSTNYIEYDLGREFLKDRPGLLSERRLKLGLSFSESNLRTVHWLESGRGEIYVSKDGNSWSSDVDEFRNLLNSLRPTSESFQEIKNYMLAFVSL
ncbi:hypothetical protein GWK48_08725 [Metallosphaera tengchongensis]|uniref:Uncharacterized protein n=1 Tax=Metallosphaera tengchongensis TaxID=1532350 RepID=A0A6N0NU76_9CREN|nr:hypothetical protein [Metallosphaera tengchongensis]QKR00444.1 hypothetical protein GWK48_08725 [Metallosphaera tengchongensis]